jgi:transposase
VVHSEQAEDRVRGTVEWAVNKEYEKLQKKIKKLHKKKFYCEPDARDSISFLQKEIKYHSISIDEIVKTEKYKGRGRPSKTNKKEKTVAYYPRILITVNKDAIDYEIKKRAIFIIATNELSEEKLTDQEVFECYKGQQTVERGFRFLKDPLFFASSLFLKKPERIVALTMVMCLSLLVYSICERKLRKVLEEQKTSIMNQVGKPTQRPTLRWIFQMFEDVHLVKIEDNENVRYEVKNLRPDGIMALNILGENYMSHYLLA